VSDPFPASRVIPTPFRRYCFLAVPLTLRVICLSPFKVSPLGYPWLYETPSIPSFCLDIHVAGFPLLLQESFVACSISHGHSPHGLFKSRWSFHVTSLFKIVALLLLACLPFCHRRQKLPRWVCRVRPLARRNSPPILFWGSFSCITPYNSFSPRFFFPRNFFALNFDKVAGAWVSSMPHSLPGPL